MVGAKEVKVVARDIRRVLIVGSGTMGMEIGFQCALYGCEVALSDADPAALATLDDRARATGRRSLRPASSTPRASMGRSRG